MARDGDVQLAESRDWSELIQKTIDDGSRVIRAELRLFEQNVRNLLDAQGDRLIGALSVMAAVSYGAALILVGVVFLLNLWLVLWLSFVVVGVATVVIGVVVQMALARRGSNIAPSSIGEGIDKPIDTVVRESR